MRTQEPSPKEPIGSTAFGSLRAEDEIWLPDCFVPPDDFDLMRGMQSIAVFGAPGSGKSAVRKMLIQRCHKPSGEPQCLIAHWQPMPPVFEPFVGFQSVPGQVAYVFDACSMAVVEHLIAYPEMWARTAKWARRLLTWFVYRFTQGDLQTRAGLVVERRKGPGRSIVGELLHAPPEQDLLPANNWSLVAEELTKALVRSGLEGLWVVVDNLEPRIEAQPDQVASSLGAFLSTLPMFEVASFAYKAFVPQTLQSLLASAGGLERRRIRPHRLIWKEPQLVRIVERRLALATGKEPFHLEDLCSTDRLINWLRRGGGDRPRAWLELIRPLIVHYIAHDLDRPIEEKVWLELRQQSPPRLVVDERHMRVTVGGRGIPVKDMTSGGYRLLCYLYRNAGRLVPWKELYYCGYRGLERVPLTADDEGYEDWFSCERTLHTRMSDLRKAIEPEPKAPVYLETVKGEGVVLRVSW
jgi:DNA-binding response OmpR family regulator